MLNTLKTPRLTPLFILVIFNLIFKKRKRTNNNKKRTNNVNNEKPTVLTRD